jgi:hypothetical protein
MKRFALLLAFSCCAAGASSTAFADASKDAVAGAVMHGEVKLPREAHRPPVMVKDEPSTSKTAPLWPMPASKLK